MDTTIRVDSAVTTLVNVFTVEPDNQPKVLALVHEGIAKRPGRLEALLNFQTTVVDLTGLPVSTASLLDEATAAAEAMQLAHAAKSGRTKFVVADDCHPQTIDVVRARGAARGITVLIQPVGALTVDDTVCGVLIQYPNTFGAVADHRELADRVHAAGALLIVATDLLALTLLTPPGEWGADIAVGNAQRFGVPFGYGGPHAAFFATKEDFKRLMPGRIIGVSRDVNGKAALRMALGTREQHIRREKATSNICTAQVLLAVMSGFYAVFHGPDGLTRIAHRVPSFAESFAAGVRAQGHTVLHDVFFDTVHVRLAGRAADAVKKAANAKRINLRYFADGTVGVSFGETVMNADLADLLGLFGSATTAATQRLSKVSMMGSREDYSDLCDRVPHGAGRQGGQFVLGKLLRVEIGQRFVDADQSFERDVAPAVVHVQVALVRIIDRPEFLALGIGQIEYGGNVGLLVGLDGLPHGLQIGRARDLVGRVRKRHHEHNGREEDGGHISFHRCPHDFVTITARSRIRNRVRPKCGSSKLSRMLP